MNVLISKNCRRAWLKLPCAEFEMQEAMEKLQCMSVLDTNVLVVEVDDAVTELQTLAADCNDNGRTDIGDAVRIALKITNNDYATMIQ